jgi:phage-related baseplate assembly protein
MSSLPEPDFIMRDPAVVEQEVLETWESLTGLALSPLAPERLLLATIAYRESLCRIGIQEAAKLNLARYSRFPMIDFIGEMVGAERLAAAKATTTIRFELAEVYGSPVSVPAGTRRKSRDGRVVFETDDDAVIATGDLYIDVPATATLAGVQANGYIAGQISVEVDEIPLVTAAANTTATDGGTTAELDPRYIERILLAPDAVGAGSKESYRFGALSASVLVADVAVLNPEAGDALIVVLATTGLPSQELLDTVEAQLSAETFRPLCDTVAVGAPTEVNWSLAVRIKLFRAADLESVMAAAELAADSYRASREGKLGRDLVPSQIARVVGAPGIYSVIVDEPAQTSIAADEWAHCDSVLVEFDGWVDEEFDDEVAGA